MLARKESMKNYIFGYSLMFSYVLITALSLITINTYEQTISTEIVSMYSFLICIVFFNLINMKQGKSSYKKIFTRKSVFIYLNILTLIIWSSTFAGLNSIEPIFFVILYMASMPLTTSFIHYYQSKNYKENRLKNILLFFVVLTLCFLIKEQISGLSMDMKTLKGISLAILAGATSSVYIHYTRAIQSTLKLTTVDFLASRFYFTTIFSFSMIIVYDHSLSINLTYWYKFFIVALLTTIIPLFCLQKAISFLPPARITYFMPLTPLATYALQYIFGYPINLSVLILVLFLTVFLITFSLFEKKKQLKTC
jgi:drug/metabolite transporter (DMT)-like permease